MSALRNFTLMAMLLPTLGLGACATDGNSPEPIAVAAPPAPAPAATSTTAATAANADRKNQGTTPDLSTRMRFRTDVQEPAQFVREARPQQQDYIPVGVTPQRTGVQRSAQELQAIEKELDAQRQRSRAYANRPKPASTYDGKIPPRQKLAPPTPAE